MRYAGGVLENAVGNLDNELLKRIQMVMNTQCRDHVSKEMYGIQNIRPFLRGVDGVQNNDVSWKQIPMI